MCGISGLIDFRSSAADRRQAVAKMTVRLAHRGPDGEGIWLDADHPVALGHRRLAIVELSDLGAQPMSSHDGRYVLSFNGEIYNFRDLQERLRAAGVRLRGESDTEALLETIAREGVRAALDASSGMFAFAVWDRVERALWLARDRMGEKPLYYGYLNGPGDGAPSAASAFGFASELGALRAWPRFDRAISRNAVASYLRYGYVPSPASIFEGISKLRPGHLLRLSLDDLERGMLSPSEPYWRLEDRLAIGPEPERGDQEWIDDLEAALKTAVGSQMRADVPIGAFLSGGIDSTTVVAFMGEALAQAGSREPVRTFSLGFRDAGYDEAPFAREIARRLGTAHTELYVSPEAAQAAATAMPSVYDEPFADSSQIPTFLVSRLAREHVTVCLSGDGGDELFGGYNRYVIGERIFERVRLAPEAARRALGRAILSVPPHRLDALFAMAAGALPARLRFGGFGDRAHKIARALSARSSADFFSAFVSIWQDPASAAIGGFERDGDSSVGLRASDAALATFAAIEAKLPSLGFGERMMATDALSYLPGDILTKVDRASMACGLEARVPFLDPRVIALAWRAPKRMKIRDGEGKWMLRQALYRRIPAETMRRPKTGFSIPLDIWLRGPLCDWAESALSESSLKRHGFLEPRLIRAAWEEHVSGRRNRQNELWCALMLQSWLDESGARPTPMPALRNARGLDANAAIA